MNVWLFISILSLSCFSRAESLGSGPLYKNDRYFQRGDGHSDYSHSHYDDQGGSSPNYDYHVPQYRDGYSSSYQVEDLGHSSYEGVDYDGYPYNKDKYSHQKLQNKGYHFPREEYPSSHQGYPSSSNKGYGSSSIKGYGSSSNKGNKGYSSSIQEYPSSIQEYPSSIQEHPSSIQEYPSSSKSQGYPSSSNGYNDYQCPANGYDNDYKDKSYCMSDCLKTNQKCVKTIGYQRLSICGKQFDACSSECKAIGAIKFCIACECQIGFKSCLLEKSDKKTCCQERQACIQYCKATGGEHTSCQLDRR